MNNSIEPSVSLKDINIFLLEYWKLIISAGLIGLIVGLGIIFFVPNQYEAIAHVKVAQIGVDTTNPVVTNLEDPNLLITRMKWPSFYSSENMKICDLGESKNHGESLVNLVKVSTLKGINSIIELRIRMNSRDQSINCLQAVFQNIRQSQSNILKPYIYQSEILLLDYQTRLKNVHNFINKADESNSELSAIYLISRDEIKFLTAEILRLKGIIGSGQNRGAELVAPIYASEAPVSPNKKQSLLIGLLGGLFLGVLFAFAHKVKIAD